MSAEASNTGSTPNSSRSTSREKKDPAWGHCREVEDANKRKKLQCLYCSKLLSGGGIQRVKQHLAGVKGQVERCKKVPPEVGFEMNESIEEFSRKKRKAQELLAEDNPYCSMDFPSHQEPCLIPLHMVTSSFKSGEKLRILDKGKQKTIGHHFMPRTTAGAQPTLKSVLQSKDAVEKVDILISKWMIDSCIPFNATNSNYYQSVIDGIAHIGPGYKGPTVHALRGYLLMKNVEEVNNYVETFRSHWKECGCTIMADGWTDQYNRTLINFLFYCPKGTVFLKSVDASDASKTAELLHKLFRDIVLYVGAENVVHMVIDNAANYVAAGRLLEHEFKSLYWSPCAAHCVNLMLKDMGKLDEVEDIVKHASKITKYIYNHCYALHLMRKFTEGREIIRPAPTRFATNFIALQSILTHKNALRAMVVSREWTSCAYAKDREGKKFVENVLDTTFWKECAIIVQLTEPLIRVLRLVDSGEKLCMGYLYQAFHKAKDDMVARFHRRKKRVEPYLQIISSRWDNQLSRNLHAAGYWFNPRFQYSSEFSQHQSTVFSVIDVIERYANGNFTLRSKLTREMSSFRKAEGDFGRWSAVQDRCVFAPDEWWALYGCGAPNLQKLAIRVLSQTCSASGCEKNWSIFEHIHSKKRNRLEHQRLNDLVFVHSNLRLQQRNRFKTSYDPINFEEFDAIGSWILMDEPSNLNNEELELLRNELASVTIQDNPSEDVLDEIDGNEDDEVEGESGDDDDEDNRMHENVIPIFSNVGDDIDNL